MAAFDRFVQSAWAYAAVAVIIFLAALPGIVSMPTLDRDEARFAQASAQMLETGDFVVIRFHDELRNKKPAGIHWMQSAAVGATSSAEARDISAFRLPSLIAAMGAAMAALWAGTALFTRRAAFIGSVLLASTLLLTTEAHIAKTDAALVFVITLGMAALAWLRRGAGRGKAILFWVCMGVGVMLKGPIAPLVAGSAIAMLFALERKFEWARPLLYWGGISLFCIITVPWILAVQIATGGDFLTEAATVDLGQKLVTAAEYHAGPPGMHVALLPLLFWPGTLFLAGGLWLAATSLFRRQGAQLVRKGDAATKKTADAVAKAWTEQEASAWRFIACWIIPAWLVFEIVPTKLVHYTLPMYPAIALAAGVAADNWLRNGVLAGGRLLNLALFVLSSVLVIAAVSPRVLDALRGDAAGDYGPLLSSRIGWVWDQEWAAAGSGVWPMILIGVCVLLTGIAFFRKMHLAAMGGMIVCALAAGVSYRTLVLPNQTWLLHTEAALSALNEVCAAPEGTAQRRASGCDGQGPVIVRSIAYAEPSLVFELAGRVSLPPKSTAVLPPVAEDPRPAWLINTNTEEGVTALGEITAAAAAEDRCVRLARRHVMNYSLGKPLILVAAVVEPGACPVTEPVAPPPELEPEPELEQ
jgi:4-amino-4-deoxy-L-arabinose transferase-like glycosyltransferase